MQTLFGEALRRGGAAADAPAALVVSDREVSYRELDRRVRACAAWLLAAGCRPREVVGVAVADDVDHLVVSFALLVLGVPQVPLPTFDPPAARRRLAERLGVSRVVVSDPAHAIPGAAMSKFEAPGRMPERREVAPVDANPDAVALFQPTSGTTGEPKILAMSQRLLDYRQRTRNFEDGERLLSPLPIEAYPARSARLGIAWRGFTSILAPGGDVAGACARHDVTRLEIGVLQLANLIQRGADALPARTKVFVSGSRVPMRMREQFRARAHGPLFVEYGAREIGAGTSTYPVDRDEALESVGPPSPVCELEIVDAAGEPVAPGEVGEIRCRSAGMVDGYVDDPGATARHFRDGWYHPGDLGSFTPRGSLCLAGRADDVINLNGIKIYPSEIERVVEEEPGVRAAAAFAVGSDVHGEIPVVAIEWVGPEAPDLAAMRARARARLGARAPRKVLRVDALPRNASGKVTRQELMRLVGARRRDEGTPAQ